jgi:sterol 3beta-glucosyltransferase
MKIAILTIGTRGDVQPYAVLGQALKAKGHEVTLATGKNFEALVKSYDIDFVPVEADFQAVLETDEGKKMMKGNPFAVKRNLNTWLYPLISNSLKEYYTLAKDSDKVIYHVKTMADCFADQFPDRMIRASVQPIIEPTNEFANPAFSGLWIPKFLYKLSYSLANKSINLLSKPIGTFRTAFDLPKKFTVPAVKNVYGVSSHFLPTPKDYPNTSKFTGFWFGTSREELPQDLTQFIEAGQPPLLITFGSMPFKSKFDLANTLNALTAQFNTRLIVVKGWGLTDTSAMEHNPNIKVIGSAPYEKLFPKVKAIVHHGGIGTTAECLRAGKPFFICPILHPIGDQMFWGKVGLQKGIAVKPIPLAKISQHDFIKSIDNLLKDNSLYKNALQLKSLIDEENGLEGVIEMIEK